LLIDYPEATGILFYRGEHRLKEGKVICIPVEGFLKNWILGKKISVVV
jgi:hypothetical protein